MLEDENLRVNHLKRRRNNIFLFWCQLLLFCFSFCLYTKFTKNAFNSCPGLNTTVLVNPGQRQGYSTFYTVQYNRILNPKLSDNMREILRHFDEVSKISKICLYNLQDNLEPYNQPRSRPVHSPPVDISFNIYSFCLSNIY